MKAAKRKYGLEPRRYADGGKVTLEKVNAELPKKQGKPEDKPAEKPAQDFVRG